MQNIKQIANFQRETNIQKKQEKIATRISFLKLVLCDKKTIRASAQICKLNFSTAKAILNKFRRHGVIQQSYKDQDSQLDLLRQIVKIQKGIRCQQISKIQQCKQKLNNKLQLFLQNNQMQRFGEQFNFQLKMDKNELELQLRQEQQIEYNLVSQILEQQIILMKKTCQ